jgi:hypothetical protein
VAAASDSYCRGACVRRFFDFTSMVGDIHRKRNRRTRFAHPAIFERLSVYCLGAPGGLAASFFAPLPTFTSTSVADIV